MSKSLLMYRCFPALLLLAAKLTAAPVRELVFNRDIRPILSENCFACHGTDSKKRKADLRLDAEAGAKAALEEGRVAIKSGDPAGSELWKRINETDPDEVMPPPKTHKTLTTVQKEALKLWITQGAKYQKHWAFEQLVKPAQPEIRNPQSAIRNPIDAFIVARLAQEGLKLSPPADKATLLRRVTLDLTGLPPTPEEVSAFLSDESPEAYQKVVARLLASPRFGEHMAHWWLDLARYGDTHGQHLDNERQMWLYRDWVVNAFNLNEPFDQFTIEQLAGDLIPNGTDEQKIASGYNRCNVTTGEGGSIDAEQLFRYASERTATTMQNWLGLTGQCAACHDHKFDPITQKDFYQMYAFFYSAADPANDGNVLLTKPVLKYMTPENRQQLDALKDKLEKAREKFETTLKNTVYQDPFDAPAPANGERVEDVWMDDALPEKAVAKTGNGKSPAKFVGEPEVKPASGKLALKRQDDGIVRDYYEGDARPLYVPQNAVIQVMVRLDSAQLPSAVMLQFRTDGWKHRAVWGDVNAINQGVINSPERFSAGPLPKADEWVKLEVPAEKVGLKGSDFVTGFAFTQSGGLVYWDRLSIVGDSHPPADAGVSFKVWRSQHQKQGLPGAPKDINNFLTTANDKITPEQTAKLREYYLINICTKTQPVLQPLTAAISTSEKEVKAHDGTIPSTFIMADLPTPRQANIMLRGAYDKPGEAVQPNVPGFLPPLPAGIAKPNRLDLAKWIASSENPLTARVAVNRFWQHFFGLGLVKSSSDFGAQGEPPSHPELLDFLAAEFRENGWDMKKLITTIVTSQVYQQSSDTNEILLGKDPANRLLARAPRLRLNAEAIRDQALFVSGLLVEKVGGKAVRIYQPPNIWEPVGFVGSNTRSYKQDSGEALYRRSIYTFLKRTAPAPFLVNFDAPSREAYCTKRDRGNTPLQALQLLNDVQFFEAARAFAQRIITKGGDTTSSRITFAFQCALNRGPDAVESGRIQTVLNAFLEKYRAKPDVASQVITVGESKADPTIPPAELAAWTQVANLLLNLDEVIVRP